jgi:hypothetical protein
MKNLLSLLLNSVYFVFVFVLFIVYYKFNPPLLRHLYDTLGGRLIIILLILFGCTINLYVGLLVLLFFIGLKPFVYKEGMNNMNLSSKKKSNLQGVDRIAVADSLRSKSSKTLDSTNTSSSEDVEPFSSYN